MIVLWSCWLCACGAPVGTGQDQVVLVGPEGAPKAADAVPTVALAPPPRDATDDAVGTADDAVPPAPVDPCADSTNASPDVPSLVSPGEGIVDTLVADFVLRASPFSDADAGQGPGGAEFEIWTLVGGRLDTLAWHAELGPGDGGMEQAALAQGQFDALPDGAGLAPWTRYAARVRYTDDDASCPASSEWSEPVPFRNDDGSAHLFDPDSLYDYHVTIPAESWDAINAQAIPDGCVVHPRDYHSGTLRFGEQVFEGIGVRVKGGCGSARTLDEKAGLKLDLGWDDPALAGCPEARRLFGQNKLTFNNMVQDPSYARERLSYRLYRALGVPAPRVAHVRVHINGEYRGVYLLVESVARRMLARNFGSNDGDLYEGTYGCDLVAASVPDEPTPAGQRLPCMERKLVPAPACDTPDPPQHELDHSAILGLIAQLDASGPASFDEAVGMQLNMDAFLSALAVDSLVGNWDGYFSGLNNYRVYRDPSDGLWSLLPSGLDQTLQPDGYDPWSAGSRISSSCFDSEACSARFVARLEEAIVTLEELDLAADLDRIGALIGAAVAEEVAAAAGGGGGALPWEVGGDASLADELDRVRARLAELPAELRGYVAAHAQ